MPTSVVCESLEGRNLRAGSPYLDPKYAFSAAALTKMVGANVSVYQAVPAAGDRTYLLAERYTDRTVNGGGSSAGFLTLVAVTADGKMDASFGTGGVVKSGRMMQPHFTDITSPGLLKVDTAGRLYFADDTRVMRFRANGSPDRTFGTNGVVTYSDASQPVALCDIAPTDNGVMVGTTKEVKGIEYFGVLAIGRHVRKVWSTTHDTGLGYGDNDGTGGGDDPAHPETYDDYQSLAGDKVQFVQSAGGLMLVRIETNEKEIYDPYLYSGDDYNGGPTGGYTSKVTRQDAVVTRFDTAYHGTDVASYELKRGDIGLAYLGSEYTPLYHPATVLSKNGRVLLVQTDQQVMRIDLNRHAVRRYDLPDRYALFVNPRYHLLPDGNVWVFDELYKQVGEHYDHYYRIYKFAIDGTPDKSFAGHGVLIVRDADYARGLDEYVKQVFIGASGRLYFMSSGEVEARYMSLTVRRV